MMVGQLVVVVVARRARSGKMNILSRSQKKDQKGWNLKKKRNLKAYISASGL
jgi:hypothetical protein